MSHSAPLSQPASARGVPAVAQAFAARQWRVPPAVVGGAIVGLLAAIVALWALDSSGYANTYYSAAAQAAGQSWTAMFFGSIDAAGFITIDKPPASIWLMGLSVRMLGLSPFSILLPEALCGVAAVLLLYDAVRRQFGIAAAVVVGVDL